MAEVVRLRWVRPGHRLGTEVSRLPLRRTRTLPAALCCNRYSGTDLDESRNLDQSFVVLREDPWEAAEE
jgi:hypothetical protein